MDKAMLNIVAKTHADLSNKVKHYKEKLERLECRQVFETAASMEYHYMCIRDNLHQIDYHLLEIENQCKQLDVQPMPTESAINKSPLDNETKSMRRPRICDETPILTPSFMRTVDEFFVLEASLQRTPDRQSTGQDLSSHLASKSKKPLPQSGNQQQPTPWDETML